MNHFQSKTFKHDFKTHLVKPCVLLEENGTRQYDTLQGKKYPSVTSMLGHFKAKQLIAWQKRSGDEATKIKNKAALRGTKFHKICENYLLNQATTFATPLEKQIFINTKPYLDLMDDIHLVETRMFSHHLRLAGTVDCVARYDNKLSIIDFKTSSKQKRKEYIEHYFIQAAAYAIMFEEQTKIPVPQVVIIIAVEGQPSDVFIEKRNNYVKQLLSLRDAYEEHQNEIDL